MIDIMQNQRLLKLLNSRLSFTEIGKHLGVSRERVRQLYNKYRRQLTAPPGRVRQRIRTLRRHRAMYLKYLRSKPYLNNLCRLLRMHGITINYKPANPPRYFCRKSIILNGKSCGLHVTFDNRLHGQRRYSNLWSSLSKLKIHDFIILCQVLEAETRYFIFPAKDLLKIANKKGLRLYPPVNRGLATYNNITPSINYWDYENAFYLIKEV